MADQYKYTYRNPFNGDVIKTYNSLSEMPVWLAAITICVIPVLVSLLMVFLFTMLFVFGVLGCLVSPFYGFSERNPFFKFKKNGKTRIGFKNFGVDLQ